MVRYFFGVLLFFVSVCSAQAGPYLNSAHGDTTNGVDRPSMSGYSTGNCGHCHEQHASVGDEEPTPVDGGPSPYALFTTNFDTTALAIPYTESDNLCFRCHYDFGSIQPVTNNDFSETFGCGPAGVNSILDTYNQTSYQNLSDIYKFATNTDPNGAAPNPAFSWVTMSSNPCSTCHNSHLARRNNANPADPTYTAISKPSEHENLWGDGTSPTNERMSVYPSYIAPYCNVSALTREPAGVGVGDGSDMPDYVAFCTDCHNAVNDIWTTTIFDMASPAPGPSTPPRNLIRINTLNEVHGGASNNSSVLLAPYTSGTSYQLSCMDCHEPHASSNIVLVRRWVNGGSENAGIPNDNPQATVVTGGAMTVADTEWATLCGRCHGDKFTISASHHVASLSAFCLTCHPLGNYASCTDCHYHGSTFTYGAFINQPIF